MEIESWRRELSIDGKNGIAFLMPAVIVWGLITLVFLLPFDLYTRNILMLGSCGLMFPLTMASARVLQTKWSFDDHPLGNLGFILNLAQLMYFPLIFWAISRSPEEAVMVFAVITGAHFFPYGWFYQSLPFYVMAPMISVSVTVIGLGWGANQQWIIASTMTGLLVLLIGWLVKDYQQTVRLHT